MKETFKKIRSILLNDKKIRYVVLDFEENPEAFRKIIDYHISTGLGNYKAWTTTTIDDKSYLLFSVTQSSGVLNVNYNSTCETAMDYISYTQDGSIRQNVHVRYEDVYTPETKKPKRKLEL